MRIGGQEAYGFFGFVDMMPFVFWHWVSGIWFYNISFLLFFLRDIGVGTVAGHRF